MSSLIRNFLSSSNTPTSSTKPRDDGFHTANLTSALFPHTTPEVDGEECLHDCETCTVHYPRNFKIEEDDQLFGEIKGWSRHLIVATGKKDWVRDVEDEKESVMQAIGKHGADVKGGRLMLSASDIPLPDDADNSSDNHGPYGPDRKTTVLLLPSFTFIDNVTPHLVPDLINSVINPSSTNTTSLSPSPTNPLPTTNFFLRNCPHRAIILLCSQATRDARCGQSAPLLRRELERHLRPLNLYRDHHDMRPGGVGIYFISHVGGHKYSANMLVYRRRTPGEKNVGGDKVEEAEAAQCIWLARIRPEDCENVVRYTVLQGKVVKPERQLRGGFDRERGVVSW